MIALYYEKAHSYITMNLLEVEHFFRFVFQTFAEQITEATLRNGTLTS